MEEKDLIENEEKEKTEEYVPNEWEIKYVRLQAEFENFRQRLRREKEEWQEIANARLLKEIVEIMDNFQLALESIKHTRKKDAIIEGVQMIYKQFENLLEKEGVVKMETIGKNFDPNLHEAVGIEEVSDGEDNVILKEISPGYLFKNRLLRPARVIVSKKIQKKEVDEHGEDSRN
ncbi:MULTISPECIES: nucleotide exchange factor GrpE [Dictyoglomus]|jgi:molecular chaperone GrpE|uniref:Protein GrpE n=1 Tax=Dictyoglomus turgidum (strain DSM 6724 / Z-1310) TaxID=515635 RepID=B8DYH5_DICTD|nr:MULTISPECIES: nucleotide exchange factor GrpE [Dictyoglomus]ACK41357.1 GrpE protein [Dictyoglomus turgidum DSM 6724]HBU31638.1 nucleotide exchange factor GrpE [Dictyoglomus sp.]